MQGAGLDIHRDADGVVLRFPVRPVELPEPVEGDLAEVIPLRARGGGAITDEDLLAGEL